MKEKMKKKLPSNSSVWCAQILFPYIRFHNIIACPGLYPCDWTHFCIIGHKNRSQQVEVKYTILYFILIIRYSTWNRRKKQYIQHKILEIKYNQILEIKYNQILMTNLKPSLLLTCKSIIYIFGFPWHKSCRAQLQRLTHSKI